MKTKKQSELSAKILLGIVAAGLTFGVNGITQAADLVNVVGTTETANYFHNLTPTAAQYRYGNIMNNTLSTENYTGDSDAATGGGIFPQCAFSTTALKGVQTIVIINGEVSGNTVKGAQYRAEGGGVFLKGSNVLFVNKPITNNKAISVDFAHGGAVATHYNGNSIEYNGKTYNYLVPGSVSFYALTNKTVSYTGNDIILTNTADYNKFDEYAGEAIAPSGGGFLSLFAYGNATFNTYDGASITVGNETPATATEDSISSAIVVDGRTDVPEPAITKKGNGTLTINSSLNRYYGTFTQQAGTVNLNQDLNWANKYDLQAGTLNLKNVTLDNMYDKLKLENLESTIDPDDSSVLHTSTYLAYFDKTYNHTIVNSTGNLVTAAGTTVNAQDVTLKDGGSINAEGALNLTGDLSADASTVTAANATIGGTVSSTNGSTVTLGGDSLALSKVNVDANSSVALNGGTLTATKLADSITGGGKVTLAGTATLATTANQIFTDTDTTEKTAGENALTSTADASVKFKAGTLSLSDDYSYTYLTNIQGVMDGLADSTTALVMTGNLVDTTGVSNTLSTDAISTIGNTAALDSVTVNTDNKDLVIGSTTTEDGAASVSRGFSVASLDLGSADSVTVTGGQSLTLGGRSTTDVITTTSSNGSAEVALTDGSSLTIGNAAVTADQTLNVNASVAATNSTVTTNGQTTVEGNVSLTDSTIAANTGSLTLAKDLTTSGTSTITGDVAVAGTITGTANTTLNLGTGTTAATLTADKVSLNGGTLYLDPVWNGGTQIDGTEVAIESLDGTNVVVGENSTLTLGSKDTTAAENMFKETGLSWGSSGILSALYLASSQDLTNNSIVVSSTADNTKAGTAGTFSMGDNSLLMVSGSTVSGSNTAAITGVSTTSVSDSAKLYISGATAGTTYNILSGSSVKSGNAWYADANADTTSNVFTHNQLLKFVGAEGNGDTQYSVTAEAKDATDVYGNALNAANVVSAAVAAGGAAGTLFGNAANSDVHSTTASQVNALNSATSLTELAGVQHGLYTAGNLFTGAVANHLADVKDTTLDKDLWAHYIHDKENIRGLAVDGLSGADYDAQYNGVVVGSDLYHKNGVVAGAALTYMDGSFSGNTDTASTKNDADYYGLSLYGRVRRGQTSYLGDISWLHGKNDLSQYNSGSEITGDVSSNAYTAGVRAEHDFAAGDGTLTPYAGVRYAHLDYGNYTDSLGIHHDSDNANLWLIPVGLRYTQDFSMDGWNVKPIAEAGYLWTLGDRNSDERLNINGSASTFGYDVSDSGSFYGRLGIEAEHGPMTYGLGYQYQKGSDVRSNVWSLALRYKF